MADFDLKDWFIHYKKNRNLMLRTIEKFNSDSTPMTITYKDGSCEECIIFSGNSFVQLITKKDVKAKICITCPNTQVNANLLIKEWDELAKYSGLTLIFANPSSNQDKQWVLKPYVHNRISDPATLKEGLLSMASTVDYCE